MERCSDCLRRSGLAHMQTPMMDNRDPLDESEYRVTVDGHDIVARRGRHVVYRLTVHRGTAHWPLRRRFRQFVALHKALEESFGRSEERRLLPRLPPKWTFRSACCGQQDDQFLATRAAALQRYLEDLLRFIPFVDQSEVLREFLCSVDINSMSYSNLVDLGEALGEGSGNQPRGLEAGLIESLPKRDSSCASWAGADASGRGPLCVICQEPLADDEDEDIRVLPCRHEYHYPCISQWLQRHPNCCICQQEVGEGLVMDPAAPSSE